MFAIKSVLLGQQEFVLFGAALFICILRRIMASIEQVSASTSLGVVGIKAVSAMPTAPLSADTLVNACLDAQVAQLTNDSHVCLMRTVWGQYGERLECV